VNDRSPTSDEAILAKRRRIGMATEFGDGLVSIITASIIAGSLILAPAIVFGYAVKAAERDDRDHGRDLS
jgi:hypothetical protein